MDRNTRHKRHPVDALRQWTDEIGGVERAAPLLGVTASAVSHWRVDRFRPGLRTAILLEEVSGLPARDWISAPPWPARRKRTA